MNTRCIILEHCQAECGGVHPQAHHPRTYAPYAVDLATEHATQQRSKAKLTWYVRRAAMRTFAPGDKVLVLLPMPGKPLHAKFHGPYIVEEQCSLNAGLEHYIP